jgi:Bax protein
MPVWAQEVIVLGSQEETLALLEQDKWWTEKKRGQRLEVPYTMVVGISERWAKNAPQMPVPLKKELFFSSLLPLVMHANSMVMDRREQIQQADARLARGGSLSSEEIKELRDLAVLLRITSAEEAARMNDPAGFRMVLKDALYKLDVIPAGLVLGQAAYESGYATSRFAVRGNALFGQWTYGGKGMVPEQQRRELGDHRIASFEWPFDSVRGYYINLSSHPAYEDFRRLRAELKASGKPLSSLALADGLQKYSERGQEYVDILKGIIRVNDLDIADNAVLRNEPMRFLLGAADQAAAAKLRKDIEAMRKSGEISKIIEWMRLE